MTDTDKITGEEILSFIERYESLMEEKAALMEVAKEVMNEAKSRGYDTKILRQIIRLRRREKEDIQEEKVVLQAYLNAMGLDLSLE